MQAIGPYPEILEVYKEGLLMSLHHSRESPVAIVEAGIVGVPVFDRVAESCVCTFLADIRVTEAQCSPGCGERMLIKSIWGTTPTTEDVHLSSVDTEDLCAMIT